MYTAEPSLGRVIRDSDGVVITPCHDPEEPNYVEYYNWLIAGNQPKTIPDVVTPRQIRLALTQMGMRAPIEAAVAGATQEVKDAWQYATEFRRDDPVLTQIKSQMGVSDSAVNQLFLLASSL